jgi:NCAIR mutase (PurE)-related protein
VCALPARISQLAIGGGHAVGDGCALADVGCERSPRLPVSSAVHGNGIRHRCISAEDGCFDAADGSSLAAAIHESAADRRVDTDARRRLVRDGRLFAIVTEESSASGCKLVHDGCQDAPVVYELAGIARENAGDVCEEAVVGGRDVPARC